MTTHVTGLLSEYLDGELSMLDRRLLEGHLRTCRLCTATLDELRWIVEIAGRATAHDRPPTRDLWAGILARIESSASARAKYFR